jgi:hypothetical protein
MFPSDWANQTGGRRKRRATDDPPQESPRDEPPPSAHSLDDLHLPRLILRNVNTASRAPATPRRGRLLLGS